MPKQISVSSDIVINLYEDPVLANFLNHQKKGTRNTFTSYFRRIRNSVMLVGKKSDNPDLWKKKIFELQQVAFGRGLWRILPKEYAWQSEGY